MFKIGGFSKLTQVSTRMLRYYDETGLLKPAKIDSLTGYRMYSAEQISTLNRIIYLRRRRSWTRWKGARMRWLCPARQGMKK
ncbi:MerR family transcriptional regulator, partial [Enterocloster clostridioformis]|uniref:MerR family transcriptional regulator n=1 Tax=Enterocloster clostridioformis TaxID=1531 RepID=UPI0024805333